MTTYLNIGPGRSGTTSFYNMCSNLPEFNLGKTKEPFNLHIIKNGNNNYVLNYEGYINNWKFNNNEHTILLDASGQIVLVDGINEFRKYLENYVSSFKFICLIRNPKKYFISKIYNNYLVEEIEKNNTHQIFFNENFFSKKIKLSIKKITADINLLFKDEQYLNHFTYSNLILQSKKIFNNNEIFILPIELFNDYKKQLQIFLNVNFNNISMQNNKTTNSNLKNYSKYKILHSIIQEYVEKDDLINSIITNDIQNIDLLFDLNLSELYLR